MREDTREKNRDDSFQRKSVYGPNEDGMVTSLRIRAKCRIAFKCRIAELTSDFDIMLSYMDTRKNNEDYHGVADAAMDIREMLAERKAWREVVKMLGGE